MTSKLFSTPTGNPVNLNATKAELLARIERGVITVDPTEPDYTETLEKSNPFILRNRRINRFLVTYRVRRKITVPTPDIIQDTFSDGEKSEFAAQLDHEMRDIEDFMRVNIAPISLAWASVIPSLESKLSEASDSEVSLEKLEKLTHLHTTAINMRFVNYLQEKLGLTEAQATQLNGML